MTTVQSASLEARTTPPLSGTVRIVAGVSLALAGILNGLPAYLSQILAGDMEYVDYIRWGADNPGLAQTEQLVYVVSMLFAPIGLLAMAQVTRWRAPVITAVAAPLFLWGMWGFQNILSFGYLTVSTATRSIGPEAAVRLNDGLAADASGLLISLAPHLLGSFVGLVLLSIACWKSRAFSRTPIILLVVFLLWDFLLPAVGPLEPHILLIAAWVWLGIDLIRMPASVWRGERPHVQG
ncbi:hypothetical protein [Glaciibacter superstes]|uniref:hypothetical protein n=1 Tax=Glaciibacter superstes TaxID=501023 RepID=UPI0003B705F4|nr:hypothetical protein [Glaciibacter superstes]